MAMEPPAIITLTHPLASGEPRCQLHRRWPAHISSECDRLAGVRSRSAAQECSVCQQRIDRRIGMGRHAGCFLLHPDGRREWARALVFATRKGERVELVYS